MTKTITKHINIDNYSYQQLEEYINSLKKDYKIVSASFTKGSVLHIILTKKNKDGNMTNKQIVDNFNKIFTLLADIRTEFNEKIDQGLNRLDQKIDQEISKIKEFVGMK